MKFYTQLLTVFCFINIGWAGWTAAQPNTDSEPSKKPKSAPPKSAPEDPQPAPQEPEELSRNPQPKSIVVNMKSEKKQQPEASPQEEDAPLKTDPQENLQNLEKTPSAQTIYSNPFVIEGMEEKQELPPYTNLPDSYTQDILTHEVSHTQQQQAAGRKRYRLSTKGELSPFYIESKGLKYALLYLYTSFGWVVGNFEVGPFALANFKLRLGTPTDFDALDATGGGFIEYNFHSYQKFRRFHPSIGLQLGYNRFLRKNNIYGRPYFGLKLFLSQQSALSWEIGFSAKTTLHSQRSYGPDLIFGFMHYFL